MGTGKKRINILVTGNATIDAYVEGVIERSDNSVKIISPRRHVERVFEVTDGPIRDGYKHRTNVDVEYHIKGLKNELAPGGGAYNTAASLISRRDHRGNINVTYLDASKPDPLITEQLDRLNIPYHFLKHRDIPTNAILEGGHDKIIIKGPSIARIEITDEDKTTIEKLVSKADAIAVNGAKDPSLVEALINSSQRKGVPLFFNISPSLDPEFALKHVLPSGVVQVNYEDILSLFGQNPLLYSHDDLRDTAIDLMKKIKKDNINKGYNFFTTMGSDGVLFMNHKPIVYHSQLNDETARFVKYAASQKQGSTNGSGDVFFGRLSEQHLVKPVPSIKEIAERASKASIRHIGYDDNIDTFSFRITKY